MTRFESSSPGGPADASVSPTVAFGSSTPVVVSVVGVGGAGGTSGFFEGQPESSATVASRAEIETSFFFVIPVVLAEMFMAGLLMAGTGPTRARALRPRQRRVAPKPGRRRKQSAARPARARG